MHEGTHAHHHIGHGGKDRELTISHIDGEGKGLTRNATFGPTGGLWGAWHGYEGKNKEKGSTYVGPMGLALTGLDKNMRIGFMDISRDNSYASESRVDHFIHDYYKAFDPIDSHTVTGQELTDPATIDVNVASTNVILIRWYVNGTEVVAQRGQQQLDVVALSLSAGQFRITAEAYDSAIDYAFSGNPDMDLIRHNFEEMAQKVGWTVNITGSGGNDYSDNATLTLPGDGALSSGSFNTGTGGKTAVFPWNSQAATLTGSSNLSADGLRFEGDFVLSGGEFTLDSGTLHALPNGLSQINSNVTFQSDIKKTGLGEVTLGGANILPSNHVDVLEGSLTATSSNAFGSNSPDITVRRGGEVKLYSDMTIGDVSMEGFSALWTDSGVGMTTTINNLSILPMGDETIGHQFHGYLKLGTGTFSVLGDTTLNDTALILTGDQKSTSFDMQNESDVSYQRWNWFMDLARGGSYEFHGDVTGLGSIVAKHGGDVTFFGNVDLQGDTSLVPYVNGLVSVLYGTKLTIAPSGELHADEIDIGPHSTLEYNGSTPLMSDIRPAHSTREDASITLDFNGFFGRLSGTGDIGKLVNMRRGSEIAPGAFNQVGRQNYLAGMFVDGIAAYEWQLQDVLSPNDSEGYFTGWDTINITGTMDLDGVTEPTLYMKKGYPQIETGERVDVMIRVSDMQESLAQMNFDSQKGYSFLLANADDIIGFEDWKFSVVVDNASSLAAANGSWSVEVSDNQLLFLVYSPSNYTNTPPVWSASTVSETDATEFTPYAGNLLSHLSDVDADTLYFVKTAGPDWLKVSPGGILSGTPDTSDIGANSWTISGTDGMGTPVIMTLNMNVVDNLQNQIPVFAVDPITRDDALDNIPYSASIAGEASDLDGDSMTFAILSGPAWLSVAADGSLSGTPAFSDIASSSWVVEVDDGNGGSSTATLNITVIEGPGNVATVNFDAATVDGGDGVLTSAENLAMGMLTGSWSDLSLVGADVSRQVSVLRYSGDASDHYLFMSGGGVNDETYEASATLNLPSSAAVEGLTFAFDMALDGAGGQLGYHTVVGMASDGSELFELIFSNGSPSYGQLAFGYIDASGSYQQLGAPGAMPAIGDTSASNAKFHLTLHDGNFDMVVANTASGAGAYTALAYNSASPGTDLAKVIFTSYKNKAGALYDNISIIPLPSTNTPPVFIANPLNKIDAVEGALYSGSIASDATDSGGDPMTFSKVSGPAWLTVASDGTLSGTPDVTDRGLNIFVVQVTAVDGSDSATMQIDVDPLMNTFLTAQGDLHDQANWTFGSLPTATDAGLVRLNSTIYSTLTDFDLLLEAGTVVRSQNTVYQWLGDTDVVLDGGYIDFTADSSSGNTHRVLRLKNTSSLTINAGTFTLWSDRTIELFDDATILMQGGVLNAGSIDDRAGYVAGPALTFGDGDGVVNVQANGIDLIYGGYIDFLTDSAGVLNVAGADFDYYESLWNSGLLKLDGGNVGSFVAAFEVNGESVSYRTTPLSAPVLNGAILSIDENLPAGTVVGTLTSTSSIGNESWDLTDDGGGLFVIDPNTGEITTTASLDFENTPSFNIIAELTDATGLNDTATIVININDMTNEDSDGDGMLDSWEITHFGNLTTAHATSDTENDGLLDVNEYTASTDPNAKDSDSDGYADVLEVDQSTDPTTDTSTPSVIYQNLYAWWKFDDGGGVVAQDHSGNGRVGVVAGAPVWTQGENGGGVQFDGVDDAVTFPMTETTMSAYSVSLWVKVDSVNTSHYSSMFNNNSTGSDMQLETNGGNPGVYQYRGASNASFGTVSLEWMHLLVSFDGTGTKLYVNGQLSNEITGVSGNVFGQLQVGTNRNLDSYFAGTIDDVMVWNRSLSVGEVAEVSGAVHTFSKFMSKHSLTGANAEPLADTDDDGMSNLIEWATGETSPINGNERPHTPAVTTVEATNEYLEFSWLHRTGGTWNGTSYEWGNITYQPEGSEDLATWDGALSTVANPANLPAAPVGFEWATTRLTSPLTSSSSRFLRLNVLGSP